MRIHRFLVNHPLTANEGIIKDKELLHQMVKVLRLQKGEQVELFNNAGDQAVVLLTGVGEREAGYLILEQKKNKPEGRKIILAAAIVKRDNFEWIVQKATEAGVSEIIPMQTDHSVKFGIQIHRLNKICSEAAEQCGRASVPVIREPEKFSEVLKNVPESGRYFFDRGGEDFSGIATGDTATLFIGPEGGWSEKEKEEAGRSGCRTVSLGKNVLRAETAATVASYLAVNK